MSKRDTTDPNPQSTAGGFVPGGIPADAVTELETRLAALKTWHAETSQKLAQFQAELEKRDKALAASEKQTATLQAQAQRELDETKSAREKLEHDRATFEKYRDGEEAALTKQKLACEEWVATQNAAAEASAKTLREQAERDVEQKLAEAAAAIAEQHEALDAERDALQEEVERMAGVRTQLDAEWASVRRVVAAQQALVEAWEAERQRVQTAQLRLVGGNDADDKDPGVAKAA